MSLDEKNLDGLLKRARWPEASAESTRRLEESWERQWSERRSRMMWIWPVAAAATIAIGIGAAILLLLNPPRIGPFAPVTPSGTISVVGPLPRPIPVLEGRPMTLRERMLVGDIRTKKIVPATQTVKVEDVPAPPALRDPRELASLASKEKDPKKQRDLIGEMLRGQSDLAVPLYLEMVVDAKRRAVALSALDDLKEPPVEALINELRNSRVSMRFAAARALGRIDGPATTNELVRLVAQNTQRREALAALMYSRGADAAEFVDEARRVPGLAITVRAVEMQMKYTQ